MAITKEKVLNTIKSATAPVVPAAKKTETANKLWKNYKDWTDGRSATLDGTIYNQVIAKNGLIDTLLEYHEGSSMELRADKSYVNQAWGLASTLLRAAGGRSPSSWFDSVTDAIKQFAEYVTQTFEDERSPASKSDIKVLKDMIEKVETMVNRYIDHFIYTKLGVFVEVYEKANKKTIPPTDYSDSRALVATLNRDVIGRWLMKHVKNLTNPGIVRGVLKMFE